MKKIILVLVFGALLFLPSVVLADTLGQGLLDSSVKDVGLEKDLNVSIANIIATALTAVGTVFLVLTVAAGIMWMTAAGNEEKISKAKKIIVGAAIGLLICITAYTITYFVTHRLGGAAEVAKTPVAE